MKARSRAGQELMNSQRPIAADANTLIFRFEGTADMAEPAAGLVSVENDPNSDFADASHSARTVRVVTPPLALTLVAGDPPRGFGPPRRTRATSWFRLIAETRMQ